MPTKPRILFLNRSYYPDAEATGQLLTQLCEDLALQFDIQVICGQPNSNPAGAEFVKRGTECRNGVTVQRVPHTRFAKSSSVGRLTNWLTFLISASWAAIHAPRPDIVVVETDPPFLCLVGALLRACFGCQLVVYLQDIHPDLGVALQRIPGGWVTNCLRRLFVRVYRRADQVVVLSNDMRSVLIGWGVNSTKITKIPNWVDCSQVKPVKQGNVFRQQHDLDGKFVVMHSGNMGYCQGLENILEAAALLREHESICFVLVGDGALRAPLESLVSNRRLGNVRFVDYQPASRLSDSLSAADLHLVSMDPRVVGLVMPSKLYGVLASGTPMVAVAPDGCELATIIEQESVGVVVPPDDPQLLADRIAASAELTYDLQGMGERARRLAVGRFDRSISIDSFASLLIDLFDDTTSALQDQSIPKVKHPEDPAARAQPCPSNGPTDRALNAERVSEISNVTDLSNLTERTRQE